MFVLGPARQSSLTRHVKVALRPSVTHSENVVSAAVSRPKCVDTCTDTIRPDMGLPYVHIRLEAGLDVNYRSGHGPAPATERSDPSTRTNKTEKQRTQGSNR